MADGVRLVEGDTEWHRGSLDVSKTGVDTMSMRGLTVGRVQTLFAVVLFALLAAGCFGEGGDREEWEDFDELSSGQSFAITDPLPAERGGSYDGVFLELSEGWAEVLGIDRELPFERSRIRLFVTVSTDTRKWCDVGEMAVRDDVTGERHVFLTDGDCISKGGDVHINGVFADEEPLGYDG